MIDLRQMLTKPLVLATSVVAVFGVAAIALGGKAWLILLLILVGVAIGCLVVWYIRRWREGKQAAQFRAGLNQNASKVPGNVHDAGRRVELDRLRQKFNAGFQRVLEEGRRKKVDFLYRHPWIMVVGEPGSGKTEAIRHSGIVSPRMQDELQGVGGTLNMDWWFTERAVILDTAGRMVFEEEAGTANNEFQEFLRLLRKGRRLTPINGLLVTVSADTLVGGTDEQIRERSTKLAEKISEIQTVLEVRFPVYVVVTKCDKITGFREFFESLDEPAMLNQILGWTNPEGLDVPFRAEQIEEHLSGVIDTLRLVRFKLLDRPGALGADKRRTDDVDSLFAFPHRLKVLAAQLKVYLEPVFAAGEWSASAPLFVRGVYFSSALWQGAVLDQELAAALGVSVDKLGDEGKVFRRDRALFLRDLFVEKILPERGLVTTSHRTEGIVLRRRIITWSTLAAVVLVGFGAFWWAHSSLNGGVANEVKLWQLAKANRSSAGFAPLIDRGARPGEWTYAGDQFLSFDSSQRAVEDAKSMRRMAFHWELEASTQKELSVPLVFRFGSDVNALRRKAQNTIFVTDLVEPLVRASRDRIVQDKKWQDQHTEILSMLIQLETAIQGGGAPVPSGEFWLKPLLTFGVQSEVANADRKSMFALFDNTYRPPAKGAAQNWPPPALSAGVTLAENTPINAAMANLKQHRQEKAGEMAKGIRAIGELRDLLIEFRKFEEKLAARRSLESWTQEIERYTAMRNEIDQRIEAAIREGVFGRNSAQMDATIARMTSDLQSGKEALGKTIMARPFAPKPLSTEALAKLSLLREVAAEVGKLSQGDAERALAELPENKRLELRELDRNFLVTDAAGIPRYKARVDVLRNLISSSAGAADSGETRLIGNLAGIDRTIADRLGEVKTPAPSGVTAAPPSLDPLPRAARELLMELYEREFDRFLDGFARFPLVSDRTDKPALGIHELSTVGRVVLKIKDDIETLNSMAQSGRPFELKRRVVRCIELLNRVAPALITGENEVAQVKVSYTGKDDQNQAIRQTNSRHVSFVWRYLRFNDRLLRAEGDKEEEIGDFAVGSENLQIGFQAFDTPGSRSPDALRLAPLADWQLFRQMLDGSLPAPARSDDGRKWRVLFVRQDERPEKFYFALSVYFAQPLPVRANWPKWQQFKSP